MVRSGAVRRWRSAGSQLAVARSLVPRGAAAKRQSLWHTMKLALITTRDILASVAKHTSRNPSQHAPSPRGVLHPRKIPAWSPPAASRSPFQRQPNTLPSAAERTQTIAVKAAAARRDYSVLPRRGGTTTRRQTRDNLPHFVFWCLDRWPSRRPSARARPHKNHRPSRPRMSRPRRSPGSRPFSRGPRPRAHHQRPGARARCHQASPPRRPPRWNGAGPSCRRPTRTANRVPNTARHDSRKTRRLALAHVQVPPETLDEVSRALLAAALAARGAVLPTPEKKTQTPSPLQAPAPAPATAAAPAPAPSSMPVARLRPTERANARRRAHEQAAAARRRRW